MKQMNWPEHVGGANELAVGAPGGRAEFRAELGGLETFASWKRKTKLGGQAGKEALTGGSNVRQTVAHLRFDGAGAGRPEELGDRTDRGANRQNGCARPAELVRPLA